LKEQEEQVVRDQSQGARMVCTGSGLSEDKNPISSLVLLFLVHEDVLRGFSTSSPV
jgi:hypothetical protein